MHLPYGVASTIRWTSRATAGATLLTLTPAVFLRLILSHWFLAANHDTQIFITNAAGPALSMYFLTVRLSARYFLGTMAVFFAALNIIKLPFSMRLGLVTGESVAMNFALIPALVVGFVIGRFIVGRIEQSTFERLVIVFTVVGAAYLLVQGLVAM